MAPQCRPAQVAAWYTTRCVPACVHHALVHLASAWVRWRSSHRSSDGHHLTQGRTSLHAPQWSNSAPANFT
jgi:hypothetical protein